VITLRSKVLKADVKAIRQMVALSAVFSPEEIDVAEELAQDAFTLGTKSHYHFLLADMAGVLAGYSCFGRIPLTDERYDLYWIVVNPDTQQQGIASQLMAETETAVRALGGKAVYAETSSRAVYTPAQRFYLKQRFAEQARMKNFYATGDDKLIYGKFL
jgi:ribosomal protein S18 acetylase RimI-like enzyme